MAHEHGHVTITLLSQLGTGIENLKLDTGVGLPPDVFFLGAALFCILKQRVILRIKFNNYCELEVK